MTRRWMSSRKPMADINIAPLVDVLLVLLVVLMLALPMFVKRLPVDLPQTSLSGAPTPIKAFSVSLKKDGGLFVGDSPISLDAALGKVGPSVSLEISADREVTYETLAKTVAAFQERGPKDISLMTR